MTVLASGAGGPVRPGPAAAAGHRLVDLRRFTDNRGSLAVIESGREIGFPVRRAYFMYAAAAGSARGAHAHRRLEQLLIAVQGSFSITVDDGRAQRRYRVDQPTRAIYVGPMVWRDMDRFSGDSICLVLASEPYDEADYIRDHQRFITELRGQL
jgi:dTDP-4-dehydrorhamnose 3,5-epimerase-like enzyme